MPWLTMPRAHAIRLPAIVWLTLAAVASRVATFGHPTLGIDEEFYLTVARALSNGATLYVDVWDRKPVGLFLLYLPAALLPGMAGVWCYQAAACAAAIATAWLIGRLAGRAGWAGGGTMAGMLYLLWLPLLGGQGGQSPVFYNLPMAGAALLLVGSADAERRRDAVIALALVGLAIQIKTCAVVEGAAFGLWALYREWRTGTRYPAVIRHAAALMTAAAAPTALAAGYFFAIGAGDAFLFANGSIALRQADAPLRLAGHAALLAGVLAVPIALAVAARAPASAAVVGGTEQATTRDARRFVRLWLAVSVAALVPMGTIFLHYGLPILLPAAILAAGVLARVDRFRLAVGVLAGAALAGQALLLHERRGDGTSAQFAALAQAIGSGPGCLYVYSGSPLLHVATGRCAVTNRLFPSHLIKPREANATGVDQQTEIARIFAAAPAVVAMRDPLRSERPAARALATRLLARDYRLAAIRPLGRKRYRIYARRSGGTLPSGVVTRFN